jgi:Phage capsid family
MKSISERVKDLENTIAAKVAMMQGIRDKASNEGRSTDTAEGEEFDTLDGEVKSLAEDLKREKRMEELAASATPVVVADTKSGSESRGGIATGPTIIIAPKDAPEKFKGQNFTRMVIAKAAAALENRSPLAVAIERWGKTNPTLIAIIKANEVPGGGTGSGEWGHELVNANTQYTGDFIDFLYGMTVYDKLPLRTIPANVMIKGQDGAATAYWVGESKAIPATTVDFMNVSLTPLKVAALAVVSNELLRDSTPAAEQLVRDALAEASSQRTDLTFISATAASSGVSPAGILQGVAPLSSSGTSANDLRSDIKRLYTSFISAKNSTGLYLVTNPSLAKAVQLMVNALGQNEFPGISAGGGTLLGDNVVVGDNVPGGVIALMKPSDIYRIGDTGVEVALSKDAMIEQQTNPAGATDTPVSAASVFTSMFQENSTAIRVIRSINFAKRRTSAVAWINDADYGAALS